MKCLIFENILSKKIKGMKYLAVDIKMEKIE